MLKYLIFFVAFPIVSSIATDSRYDVLSRISSNIPTECLGELRELVTKLEESNKKVDSNSIKIDIFYDKNLMKSLIQDFKTISTSLKSSNCSTSILAKYLLDGSVFVGENIYGEAFECLSQEDFETKFFVCSRGMVPENADVIDHLKPVAFCVTHKLECSQEDKQSFISAVYAGVDMFETIHNVVEVVKSIEEKKIKLEFQPEKYSHLLN